MALKFQQANPGQRDEIDRLMVRAFTPYVRTLRHKQQAGPYPELSAGIDRGEYYVVVDQSEIVGVIEARLEGSELKIDQVSVDPARQGDGIGGWMMKQTEDMARSRGARAITLFTAEVMDNLLRFYGRHGFVETGRGLPPHGHDRNVRVFLRKDL